MTWLFDTAPFVPRADCGNWPGWLVWVAIISNILIAISYYAIPFNLYRFYHHKKNDYESAYIILLFVSFIASCGTTHLFDSLVYRWPVYRLLILTDFITAILSVATAVLLPRVLSKLIALKSAEELQRLVEELNREVSLRTEMENKVRELNHELANQVNQLQGQLRLQGWIAEKQVDIDKMKSIITDLRKSYAGTDQTAP